MLGRARLCTPLVAGLPGWRNADTAPLPWTELTPGRIAVAAEPLTDYAIQYYQNRWKEMLSGAQLTASMLALQYITAPQRARLPRAGAKGPANRLRRFLLWAVTGAGKTEMLFPLIDHALVSGKTAAIATPRRDVVLELAPRLQKAFPAAHVVALYGGGNSAWESGEITVTTTHQLLRFAAAFDLVIVDEVDAYPFHNNPMLEYAVAKACRPGGAFVFVSATPPRRLRKDAQRGKIGQAILPARYHRQPLPVPRRVRCPSVDKLLTRHTVFGGVRALPKALARRIGFSLARGASVFLFVPYIRQVEPIAARLRVAFPAATVAGTSSEDAEREQKVLNFRRGIINILVTTTILERGVTIPRADVLVLDAHSPLFDDAALIQMSGRAGRASDDPNGNVTFAAPENTLSQQRAIRHIRKMNRLAWRQGLVDPPR